MANKSSNKTATEKAAAKEKERIADEGRIRTSALKTAINECLRKGTVKNN
jgi:hypothetical protein